MQRPWGMSEESKTAGASQCKEGRGGPQKVGDRSGATRCHLTSKEAYHSAPHLCPNRELIEEVAHQSLWFWLWAAKSRRIFMGVSGGGWGVFRDSGGAGVLCPCFSGCHCSECQVWLEGQGRPPPGPESQPPPASWRQGPFIQQRPPPQPSRPWNPSGQAGSGPPRGQQLLSLLSFPLPPAENSAGAGRLWRQRDNGSSWLSSTTRESQRRPCPPSPSAFPMACASPATPGSHHQGLPLVPWEIPTPLAETSAPLSPDLLLVWGQMRFEGALDAGGGVGPPGGRLGLKSSRPRGDLCLNSTSLPGSRGGPSSLGRSV